MILHLFVQETKLLTKPGHAHAQVSVSVGVCLGCLESFGIDHIKLQLTNSHAYGGGEQVDERFSGRSLQQRGVSFEDG